MPDDLSCHRRAFLEARAAERARLMRAKSGFTLVELMTTLAIITVLAGMFMPVVRSAMSSVEQAVATNAVGQLAKAIGMYMSDYDDMYPLAMYADLTVQWTTWFGQQTGPAEFDLKAGLLSPYVGGRVQRDRTYRAKPYLGDMSGYGYNWGYLGSDFNHKDDLTGFPNCANPAHQSELADPSRTVAFATSAYFAARWTGGDGQVYDFGFIDPPKY